MDRSLEMIVSLLAVLKAGGVCIPLDPAHPDERLGFVLQQTAARIVLTEQKYAAKSALRPEASWIVLDEEMPRVQASEKNPTPRVSPEMAACILYTSGSTGQPKGVVISHYALANHCVDCRQQYGLSSRDRVLQFSSFSFDAALEQILSALVSGASLIVRGQEIWNSREFAQKLHEFQLTVADVPTAYLHQLAADWSGGEGEALPGNCLRLMIAGGEALSPPKLELWKQVSSFQNARLLNAYGPTEAIVTATSYEVPLASDGTVSTVNVSLNVPIGRRRGDRRIYVLDRFGTPTPVGIPGELHLGGSLLAREYYKSPELTASRFIQNPFSDDPEARLYKTGDLARYLEDGNLEFLGRMDDQVKIRGFRVELGEIESILREHPAVRDSLVLTRPDSSGEKRVIAYVTSASQPLETRELLNLLKRKLPDYMTPSTIMVLQDWPLLPNGKVDRRALPEPSEQEIEIKDVSGPRDPLELQLKLLFERILKRSPIGIDHSFFELGGDSLQALELLVQIERSTGKQLPLGTLYQSSTVEALAREVRGRITEEWSSLVPLQTTGKRPPLFLLHTTPGDILGYGNLVYRLGSDQPCYGFQSLGLNEGQRCRSSIEAMAEYYVELLRGFVPHGPYYLGGWCYGGVVAVEMARLLRAQGEKIGLLALMETVAMPARLINYKYYLHRLHCLWLMSASGWRAYVREKAKYNRNSKLANRMRFRQADSEGESGGQERERLARLEYVYNTNLAALDQFRSNYYDGTITLFNAAERDPALIPDPQYGWAGLAKEIQIYATPGNHDTMLTEPNVTGLAQQLNDCLRRAQVQNGTSAK